MSGVRTVRALSTLQKTHLSVHSGMYSSDAESCKQATLLKSAAAGQDCSLPHFNLYVGPRTQSCHSPITYTCLLLRDHLSVVVNIFSVDGVDWLALYSTAVRVLPLACRGPSQLHEPVRHCE